MSKYSAVFPGHTDPVHPGWYQTQVVTSDNIEKWGMYYNYWNGTGWTGLIAGAPYKNSKSKLLYEMQEHTDANLNGDFYWRGLANKP